MGRYFKIVNKSKKEVVRPVLLGSGSKFLEIISNPESLKVLGILLTEGHDRSTDPMIGRWHGDSITIVGDYAESGLYDEAEKYKDISVEAYRTLLTSTWEGEEVSKRIKKYGTKYDLPEIIELYEELYPKEVIEGNLRQQYDFVPKKQEA